MRLSWLPSVLRAANLQVEEYPGWQTRGKDTPLTAMNPKVVVAHHTATRATSSDGAVANLLANGRTDLPGPLCHLGLTRAGKYVVIASGVANHAGAGSWQGITGNRHAVGIEAYNDGRGEPWPAVQLDAYDRGVAAILKKLDLPASRLCGHKEWAPGRKIDPNGVDMVAMRARVERLNTAPLTLLQPRRFGHVFQVDAAHHGTLPQQQALRDALSPLYGSKYHALVQNFDRFYNRKYQRSYVSVEIKDFGEEPMLGLAGSVSFALSDKMAVSTIGQMAVHEFGHVLDNTDYLTEQDRQWFLSALGTPGPFADVKETWADAFKDWRYGVSWSSLDGILLRPR